MGNHLACISIQNCDVVAAKRSNLIVVVHSAESRVLEFSGQSMPVAELMLEFPGFFISELKEQSTNVRAIPMSADNELMPVNSKKSGVAYVLLPMNRTQKPVAAQEWASWTQMVINHLSVNSVTKKQSKSERSRRASNRVAPVDVQDEINVVEKEESEVQSTEEVEEAEDIMKQVKEELSSISSSYCRRHWAPKLQTIIEV